MPVNPGDVIGSCDCPSCGAETPLKVSKNRTVYVICTHVIEQKADGAKERCGYRSFWGRVESKKIIKQYEEQQIDKPEDRETVRTETIEPGVIEPPGDAVIQQPPADIADRGSESADQQPGKPKRGRFSSLFD